MEPQKQRKYSKLLEPDEIEEVLMDETFTALAFQTKTETVSRVFAEKSDTEHAVLLQQM
jgi:hypothetical protein